MYPIIAALLFGATPTPPGPLVAADPAADRGEVRTGPPLVHTFAVKNAGAEAVTVTAVETGCGCLKPTVSRATLRPGEAAEVRLAVNTLTQPPGPIAWRAVVRFRFAGPGGGATTPDGELELRLSARLVREVSVTPPMVAFSTAGAATRTVAVADRRAAPLTVLSAAATHPGLSATVRPAATAEGVRTQEVEVAVAADWPPGESAETLILVTDDPGCRELRVPVRVTKRAAGAVTVSPESPVVRFARGQAEASVLVQLRRPGAGPVRVARVDSPHPGVRAKWAADGGPVATVRVTVAADAAGGRADLRVTLADPPGEVVVPVVWAAP